MRHGKSGVVLVAGGAGFLGSHLCDALLADGAHVICLDNFLTGRRQNLRHLEREPRFDLIDADIIHPLPARLRGRIKLDRVFNLACAASPPHYQANPEHTMLTSVVGTHNLLTLAERTGARFLQASTSEVYGDPEVHPQEESYWGHVNPTGPRACYDEGKRAAEALTFDFERAARAEVRVARIFNTYGPRMRADDGRVMHHDGPGPGPVNIGNPVELTVGDLVQRVLAMTGSRSAVVERPLPVDDPRRRRPDITRAAKLLGWQPRTSLETGLKATIAWFADEAGRETEAVRPVQALPRAVSAV
jgi:UDP-glucuronate decarboxylase